MTGLRLGAVDLLDLVAGGAVGAARAGAAAGGGRLVVAAAGREREPEAQDRHEGEDGVASFHVDWMLLLGDTNRRPRDRLWLAWILMPRGVTARWRAAIAASAAKVRSATTMHAASWPAVP